MRKKVSLVILGCLVLVTAFAVGASITPQTYLQRAEEPSPAPSIPVAPTLAQGCHYEERCPTCAASKECVCHPQLVCAHPTTPPAMH